MSTQKRTRKIVRDSVQGLTKPAIKRLGHRGGVKLFSELDYGEIRAIASVEMENIMRDVITIMANRRKKTVSPAEVNTALELRGINIGWVPPKRKTTRKDKTTGKTITVKKHDNYNIYIQRILKQVHPTLGITASALIQMNQFGLDVTHKLTKVARKLAITGGTKTITMVDVQSAVRIVLPGELAQHAVSEGTKAVTKYNATQGKGGLSKLSGLTLAPARVKNFMRNGEAMGMRMGDASAIYVAAVVEYLIAEILELSGNAARDNNRVRINNRMIMLAIKNDEELNGLADKMGFIVAKAGEMPDIDSRLLPKKKRSPTGDDSAP